MCLLEWFPVFALTTVPAMVASWSLGSAEVGKAGGCCAKQNAGAMAEQIASKAEGSRLVRMSPPVSKTRHITASASSCASNRGVRQWVGLNLEPDPRIMCE